MVILRKASLYHLGNNWIFDRIDDFLSVNEFENWRDWKVYIQDEKSRWVISKMFTLSEKVDMVLCYGEACQLYAENNK